MIYSDILEYKYHASVLGEVLTHLDCNHSIPMGDFGDGIYLSDNYDKSLAWGARGTYSSDPCINIYNISEKLRELSGYIIDPYNDDDLLFWTISVTFPRLHLLPIENKRKQEITDMYYETVLPFLKDFHWILSNRSDDGTSYFLPHFFDETISIDGIRDIYLNFSFGSQLILKTTEAEQCLSFIRADFYKREQYKDIYENWVKNGTIEYDTQIKNIFTIFDPSDYYEEGNYLDY